MTSLEISLLGPPKIELDGAPIKVDTRKAIALLAYLAIEGATKRRESLAALLWPESDSSRARAALRRTLSTLNKALGGEWLVIERGSIGVDQKSGYRLDVKEFQELLASIKEHGHGPRDVCERCQGPLSEAISLYRQDFMSGFTLRDSPGFDEWQLYQTESLRRDLERALDRVVLTYIDRGDYENAIDCARRRLRLDRLHEESHRTLMKLYAWSNRRADAVRQYRECVRILDQELKVAPLEETNELYHLIIEDQLDSPEGDRIAQPLQPFVQLSEISGGSRQTKIPLVGRVDEWQVMSDCYRLSMNRGCLILIEGEIGIGKTRLAEEFISHVAEGGSVVLSSTCHEGESNLAFGPFVEALSAVLVEDEVEGRLKEVSELHLSEAARLLPKLRDMNPGLPESAPLDSPGAQARFFEGVRQIILNLTAGGRPGVLFLDDLHYADEATLDLLTFIVRRSSEGGLCVLGCFRSEELQTDHRLRLLAAERQREGTAIQISLRRLASEETASLLRTIGLSGEDMADDLLDRFHRETEGIPFFVNEYMARIQAALESDEDIDWSVPESARSLLREKLTNVTSGAMQLLTAAAILGRPFDFEMIRQVSGRGEEEAVEMMEELLNRGLIEEQTLVSGDRGASYLFPHEKLRTLVYAETSHARRRLLHRRAAEALRRRDGDALAGQVAYHYQRAGMEAEAGEEFLRSGDYARTLFANREALSHYSNAFELGYPHPAQLLENMGDLNTLLGEYSDAVENFEGAVAYGEDVDRARYERKLGLVFHRRGDWELAERHYEAALAAVGKEPEEEIRALILSDWALSAFKGGEMARARDLARKAFDLAVSSGDSRSIAQSHNIMGILARHQGALEQAEEHLQNSLSLAEEMEDEAAQVAAMNNLALVLADEGEFDRGLETAQRALEISVVRGDRHREAALHNNIADLLQASGRKQEALSHVKQSVTIYAEIGVDADEYQPEIWKLIEW